MLNEFNAAYNYVNTGCCGFEEIQKYLFENVSAIEHTYIYIYIAC